MISTQDMIIQDTNHHDVTLHDVWAHNLEEEFAKLREIVYDYPFVAMDTEFPGVVMNPEGNFTSKADFNYKQVQCNVNKLKLIQVGLALVDSDGNFPPGNDIWQFNFEFSLYQDEYNTESIDVLKAAGIDFERHEHEGIRMEEFGELLTTSGLICKEKITWITFHSGYDFGYLIKTILNGPLPDNESSFFNFFKGYFPKSYDVKMLIRQPNTINILKGGLQECADQLQVPRIGRRHQAGSDALLTAQLFFKIKQLFFAENWDEVSEKVQGEMYGLGNTLSLLSIFHHLPAQLAMISNPSILLQNLCDPGMAMGIGENGSCSPSTATLLPDVSSTEASATNSDSSLCKFSTTTTEEKPYTVENSNIGIHMVLESGM